MPKESPSQTAGPFLHIGCTPNASGIAGVYPTDLGASMVTNATEGQRITIRGTVFDGAGQPMTDAMIEAWQADGEGRYTTDAFPGFGRTTADPVTGEWHFDTIKPGAVPSAEGRFMAPHITLWIAARGINLALQTRLYFPDESEANAADPILSRPDITPRAATLIADQIAKTDYRLDIHVQGESETIFFDI